MQQAGHVGSAQPCLTSNDTTTSGTSDRRTAVTAYALPYTDDATVLGGIGENQSSESVAEKPPPKVAV